MGRPLRAKYANTTFVDGVQEMSDTDIGNYVVPLITQKLVDTYNSPSTFPYGQSLAFDNNANFFSVFNKSTVGNLFNTYAVTSVSVPAVTGQHPVTNTSVQNTLYQNIQNSPFINDDSITELGRTLETSISGGVRRIQSMSNQNIRSEIAARVIAYMIQGGQGAYWLGTTAPSDGGTWVVRDSVYDSVNTVSGESRTTYYLFQKTTNSGTTVTRPLKRTSGNQLQEMTDAEITALVLYLRDYIVDTGIGRYQLSVTAPTPGTWVARGSFVDTRNLLTDDSYEGSYLGTFSRVFTGVWTGAFTGTYQGTYTGFFTGIYSGVYQQTFTGGYNRNFTGTFTGQFTRNFTGTFSGVYTSSWAGSYLGSYTGIYPGAYTGFFSGSYTGAYTGDFTGGYSRTFSGIYNSADPFTGAISSYTGTYNNSFTGTYQQSFSRPYLGSYDRSFTGSFIGSWTGTFGGSRDRTYTGFYDRAFSGFFSGGFSREFTGTFSGGYTNFFTGGYSGTYQQSFTGFYQGTYSQGFTGEYGGSFSRFFTGAYTGLTVSASTTTTTYTLWVRTA